MPIKVIHEDGYTSTVETIPEFLRANAGDSEVIRGFASLIEVSNPTGYEIRMKDAFYEGPWQYQDAEPISGCTRVQIV